MVTAICGRCPAACLRPRGRGAAGCRGPAKDQEVRCIGLRRLLCRHEQRPPQAVVQHEELWQPGEAEAVAEHGAWIMQDFHPRTQDVSPKWYAQAPAMLREDRPS